MPDKDVVMAKVAIIKRCLKRIKETTDLEPEKLEDIDKQDIFVLNLQRAVQTVIDLATHIIASESLGLPDTIKDNFHLLCEGKIIHKELAEKMGGMVGFRNIAVHNYQNLDQEILKSILGKHLGDLEVFYSTVLKHFGWE